MNINNGTRNGLIALLETVATGLTDYVVGPLLS